MHITYYIPLHLCASFKYTLHTTIIYLFIHHSIPLTTYLCVIHTPYSYIYARDTYIILIYITYYIPLHLCASFKYTRVIHTSHQPISITTYHYSAPFTYNKLCHSHTNNYIYHNILPHTTTFMRVIHTSHQPISITTYHYSAPFTYNKLCHSHTNNYIYHNILPHTTTFMRVIHTHTTLIHITTYTTTYIPLRVIYIYIHHSILPLTQHVVIYISHSAPHYYGLKKCNLFSVVVKRTIMGL